jgi:hypothetical protein
MEALANLLDGLTLWHWVGLGVVLLAFELMTGTFDLLWIAVAAFATALFALFAPPELDGWRTQLVVFAAAAMVLVALGRTVFKGLRRPAASHPNLNDRMGALVGRRVEAVAAFENGEGRVRLGDTVWPARLDGAREAAAGDPLLVTGADGATLLVRMAG